MKTDRRRFFIVFLIGYLAYSAIYIARLNFSAAASLLEQEDVLSKSQIGVIGSVFSLVYALAKIPNGYIGDCFSAKNVITCGLFITGFSNLLIGFFPSFLSIALFWGLNAYGQSMLWGPLLRAFSENYGEANFKKISQILVSSVAVGSIIGLLLAAECTSFGSAAACFLLPGAIALAAAFAVKYAFIDAEGRKGYGMKGMGRAFRSMLGEMKFRWIIFPAVSHGMMKDNINVWLAIYFVDTYGVDLQQIAGFIFIVPMFAFLGRLLYMPMYRTIKNEYAISAISFGVCVFAAAALCWEYISAGVSLLCLGTISAMVSMINTHLLSAFPAEFPKQHNISFIASVMDVLTYGGAGIGSLCFGMLIQHFGYSSMFFIWAGVSALSICFLCRLCRMGKKEYIQQAS